MRPTFELELVELRAFTPTLLHLAFVRADRVSLPFLAGQFLQIHFVVDGVAQKRSYSLANAPGGETLEIAVSLVAGGRASALFSSLKPGDRIEASGPYGRFCLLPADANRRYLLIGTGTGITPYRSMLPELGAAVAGRDVEVVLLQGARNAAELIYADDFRAMQAGSTRFRWIPCLSRSTDGVCEAVSGYVQQQLASLAPHPGADIAYLCGNPGMVDDAFALLKAAGLPVPAIRREKYVSSH